MAETIKIGIVGAGRNTRAKHLPGFRAIPGVEIMSVANRTRASADRVARESGIPKVYDRWEDLVAADDTDAILIGTWPNLHCPVTIAALKAGKHVLCEARMALNVKEARRMLDASRRKPRLVVQVVPSPYTLHVDRTVQDLIGEGFVGKVLVMDLWAGSSDYADPDAPMTWRQDRAKSGLNVMSLGIWYEALMRWVGEASRVLALGRVFVNRRHDAERGRVRQIEVPDHLQVLADLASGGHLRIGMSAVTGLAPEPTAWIFGSEGTLRYDIGPGMLFGARRGEKEMRSMPVSPEKEGCWRVEEEFVNAIRGIEPVRLTTFETGVKYMEFTEAVARSMKKGRAVKLPLH
ncbi:MAG: Gfo/Idh/MocA family oxidoreductase [Planctomycetota bacterium]